MPVRSNPYVSSGATYGSRGLAPTTSLANGGGGVALPLAQMVSSIIEGANYDPSTDLNRQNALKVAAELKGKKDRATVLEQQAANIYDPTVPLGDMAAAYTTFGGMDAEEAAKQVILARAQRAEAGMIDSSNMDSFLTAGDPYAAAARGPQATFSASTFPTRKKPTNVVVDGAPQIAMAEDTAGMTPLLNESEQKGMLLGEIAASLTPEQQRQTVGANPAYHAPVNFMRKDGTTGSTMDPASVVGEGVTTFSTQAQPTSLDGLRPTVKGGLQERSIEETRFGQMLDYAEGLGSKASDSDFGLVGNAKRFLQDGLQQGKGLTQFLGVDAKDIDAAYTSAISTAQANGIDPAQFTFDPNLDKLGKIGTVLIFNAASIYANQNGRSVSDKDVNLMRKFVGDPTQLMSSKAQYLNGIATMRDLLGMSKATTQGALGDAAGAAAGPPSAAPAAPEVQEGATATNPTTGAKLVFRGGQWVPQ